MKIYLALLLFACNFSSFSWCFDFTNQVFGTATDGIPSAFGDFNSDEITDLFVTREQGRKVEIFLGSYEQEPFLKPANLSCTFKSSVVTSVVPGDFNGDAFMDILVTVRYLNEIELYGHILHGGLTILNCSFEEGKPLLKFQSEPIAIDYNNDFITDLFGLDDRRERSVWVFNNVTRPKRIKFDNSYAADNSSRMRSPHANAFLDLDGNNIADIFITNEDDFEIWSRNNLNDHYQLSTKIGLPLSNYLTIGQSIFIDVESKGVLNCVLPVIVKETESKLYVHAGKWIDLNIDFGVVWGYYPNKPGDLPFTKAITLREGDYNMDGYPDLVVTLASGVEKARTVLLENVPCTDNCNFSRTYIINSDGFLPTDSNTVLGVFFDIFQDGILDVILLKQNTSTREFKTVAYKNNLEYDANFVKVMVLTGLTNDRESTIVGALGKRKRAFSTNLPGPRITCKTLDQEGNLRESVSAQIPQSAHYSLSLPYTMFGLGRTPNFVDNIGVGFASKSKDWPQLIPNSQMVIIPSPINEPNGWKMRLFVTPSKLILNSFVSLVGTCLLILIIIGILHWKERRIDRLERLQEPYRFHFDAM